MIAFIPLYKPNPVHGENCIKPSLIQNFGFRKDESLFYKNLRDVSKLIDLIEPDCFKWDDETAFADLFPFIAEFLYEAEYIKHNNEKIERKFKKISDKLWDKGICSPEFEALHQYWCEAFFMSIETVKKIRTY